MKNSRVGKWVKVIGYIVWVFGALAAFIRSIGKRCRWSESVDRDSVCSLPALPVAWGSHCQDR